MKAGHSEAEAIEICASQWILRRDRGALTPQDRAELEAWLSADSRNREAYLKLAELWKVAAALKAWRPADGRVNPDVLVVPPSRTRPRRRWKFATAALVALTLAAATLWYRQEQTTVYATKVGGYQRLLLDDGSVLQLNTDSKVRIRFSNLRREVHLLQGEAYFDIAPNIRRPFDVVAGETLVRALGTAFAVRLRDAKRVDVLVTHGRVSVNEQRESPSSSGPRSGPPASILEAGDAAQAKPTGIHREKVEPVELARRLSWQSGVLHFKDKALADVVTEFNRYNRRQVEIADPQLAALEVGGSFKTNDLESFVAAMRGVRGIEVEDGGERIVLSRPSP